MQCRGLILNTDTGEVAARPFKKFFNLGEVEQEIPDEKPLIFKKYDGSLGILYFIHDVPYLATRGSFVSEQAKWATDWFRNNVPEWDWHLWQGTSTHLFEIIYPDNKIVVDYDFSGLVSLGSIDNTTKQFYIPQPDEDMVICNPLSIETKGGIASLKELNKENEEGFVVYYPKANLHIKIKFEEYVRLHKIVTQLSKIGIWESIKEGTSLEDTLKGVPDEFFNWVKKVKKEIEENYNEINNACTSCVQGSVFRDLTRKQQAEYIQNKLPKKWWGVAFTMLDDKDYSSVIYKIIRPKGKDINLT